VRGEMMAKLKVEAKRARGKTCRLSSGRSSSLTRYHVVKARFNPVSSEGRSES